MKKVMVFGTFDGLHEGHRFLIEQAKKRGGVIVVVGTDPNVRRIKGRLPSASFEKRVKALTKAFPGITIVAGSPEDFLEPLRTHEPDLVLFGYDQKLPPGVSLEDIPCPWERAEALRPDLYKSSLLKKK